MERIQRANELANESFADANISFYTASVDYIDNDTYYSNIDSAAERDVLRGINVVPNRVNIYFVQSLSEGDQGYCGIASFPDADVQGIVMVNNCTATDRNPSTYPHELGHYLNLFHTHESSEGVELVARSNCEVAGDFLCDTPADPELSEDNTSGCSYSSETKDAEGRLYLPDTSQIMSYAPKTCRTTLSPQSLQRARQSLLDDRPELLNQPCPPSVECSTTKVCNAPGQCAATVDCGDDLVDCQDADGNQAGASCTPASEYGVGNTSINVTCTADDITVFETCELRVDDCEDPVCSAPAAKTVECTGAGQARLTDPEVAQWMANMSAQDNCSVSRILNDAPRSFPSACGAGQKTTVNWFVRDDALNSATCSSELTVVDRLAPVVHENQTVLTLPASYRLPGGLSCFRKSQFSPSITDQCSQDLSWKITGCISEHPTTRPGKRRGNPNGSCIIRDEGSSVCVKFNPRGRKNQPTLWVEATAMDDCGNTSAPARIAGVKLDFK